ncbi:hypothetical protein DIPPA_24823 [Diplonema papillatum]|nr:hypothetical protein DIPPA_24823 [Diplonema papillatum]
MEWTFSPEAVRRGVSVVYACSGLSIGAIAVARPRWVYPVFKGKRALLNDAKEEALTRLLGFQVLCNSVIYLRSLLSRDGRVPLHEALLFLAAATASPALLAPLSLPGAALSFVVHAVITARACLLT